MRFWYAAEAVQVVDGCQNGNGCDQEKEGELFLFGYGLGIVQGHGETMACFVYVYLDWKELVKSVY